MDFISKDGEYYALISRQSDVDNIAKKITEQEPFAHLFRFSDRQFFVNLLEAIQIDYDIFTINYYWYDSLKKLHISESEFGYVWISTSGLIARKKPTANSAINACLQQHTVISLLIEKAIEVIQDEKVFDIDSHKYGIINDLSPTIFHNLTFYVEVFFKAYLSLAGCDAPHSHKLIVLYQKTVDATISKGHNDSLLQVLILDPLYKLVQHVSMIPNGFKEQFIKYDDNPMDDTVILFETAGLSEMSLVIERSFDFIYDYFYEGEETHYLKPNLYQRLLDKADTEDKKERIRKMYSHLA